MVICGDVLKVLKTLDSVSVDMGVTSPPYNKQENKKGWLVNNVVYSSSSDKKDELIYQQEQIEVLNELYRIIKPGIAANIRGWRFWQTEERIYWLYKPADKKDKIGTELKSKHALCTSIWKIRPESRNTHPAPYPIAIPTRCIYSIMDEDKGIIIDPYCGSGTTLVAAKLLGHKYIGIDISDEYIEQTKTRLENSIDEYEKIKEELLLHTIKETFEDRKKRGMYKHKVSSSVNTDNFT